MPWGELTAAAAANPPHGPAYSLTLLAHVACAVIGFGTVVASALQASRLRSIDPGALPSGSVLRYYLPGVNWAGRLLYGVPLFGLALIGQSDRAFSVSDGWILAGLALWLVAAVVGEAMLWPAERRIQRLLAGSVERVPGTGPSVTRVSDTGALADAVAAARPACSVVLGAGAVMVACFVAATVLMVVQPG
jgi:hypothetical protein